MASTLAAADIIRRSVSLPADLAEKIDAIAESRHVSGNRAIVDLLADAILAYEQRRAAFQDLANRFQKSKKPAETERLREELARMTFGN
jgi:metal-responsive CopG/Arc/MetJ family transcriptional regulator